MLFDRCATGDGEHRCKVLRVIIGEQTEHIAIGKRHAAKCADAGGLSVGGLRI